jgi:hypothetical protein
MALMITKNNTGARWEITVDGKPRTNIEAAENLQN